MATVGSTPTVIVIGYGMVGHRVVEELLDGGSVRPRVIVFGEEPRAAYDRVHLSALFDGASAESLALAPQVSRGADVRLGRRVVSIDTTAQTVTDDLGSVTTYDELVLAMGSKPFVPPIPGAHLPGVFVYRTIEDVEAMTAWASSPERTTGMVVGGGLLGLEAANALMKLGLTTTVVDLAPRLMAVQLDDGGSAALRTRIEDLGITLRLGVAPAEIVVGNTPAVGSVRLGDDSVVAADIVVIAAGIRPRDELAREAGLEMGPRGGVVINDLGGTSAPHVWAVGEVACHAGMVYGLVGPGYKMAEVVADQILGGSLTFPGADLSTRLKLLGVDVASVGRPLQAPEGSFDLVYADPLNAVYRRCIVSADRSQLLGAVLVGDVSGYGELLAMHLGAMPLDGLAALVPPAVDGAVVGGGKGLLALPDAAPICSCNSVSKGEIVEAIRGGASCTADVGTCTRAGTTCGSCVSLVDRLIAEVAKADGVEVRKVLCEHFDFTREELFELVATEKLFSFRALVGRFGTGDGCEICKPTVASILASQARGYVLEGEQASLQDTNDHFLANIQRDGTYSVVPRVPGGEITADQLGVLAAVAKEFDLYTKITGGQRIDLFGARVDQLPVIWRQLIEAGFESGHAYGKALRTVKSCVGSTWCRYGVQDSVGFAIQIEHRYKGLRAPHKIKMAVSGCARECAEAQSKDVGFIATETGYDVYVCGNGGMRPRHAELLATGLDEATAIRVVDRFLGFYIRTADRLQRTATWFDTRFADGGIDELKAIVVDDAWGMGEVWEADIARHIATYKCEWTETLADPVRAARFAHFINDPTPDPSLSYDRVRGQRQPVPVTIRPKAELLA